LPGTKFSSLKALSQADYGLYIADYVQLSPTTALYVTVPEPSVWDSGTVNLLKGSALKT